MRWLPLWLLVAACGGDGSAPGSGSAPRDPWRTRFDVVVTEEGVPVDGAQVFSVGEGRPLGHTDGEGRLAVWLSRNDTVLAMRGEGARAPAGVERLREPELPVEIALRPPAFVRGRVRHEDGTPVPHALVTLVDQPSRDIRAVPEESVVGPELHDPPDLPRWRRACRPPVPELRIPEATDQGAVRADAEGRFELHVRALRSPGGLGACAPEHAPSLQDFPSSESSLLYGGDFSDTIGLELLLYRMHRVRGTVVDAEGAPLVGASVAVTHASMLSRSVVQETLTTDADGRFAYETHPQRVPWLVVRTPAGVERTYYPEEGATEVRIRVAQTRRQVVRVRCGEEAPRWPERALHEGAVHAYWLRDGDLAGREILREDRSGWHAVLELTDGRHELEVLAPCGIAHREVELGESRAPVTVRFPTEDAGVLELRNEGYTNVRLARGGRMLGTIGVDGEARLTGVAAGDYVVHTLGGCEQPVTVVAGERATITIEDGSCRP